MRVLLTGASGFIGSRLLARLDEEGRPVRAVVRRPTALNGGEMFVVPDFLAPRAWERALDGVHCIVHLAGRAHVLREEVADPLPEFRRANVQATLRLAEQAANAGAKRFVFISSIGVNGTRNEKPFQATDAPHPTEPYAISKLEAEQGLRELEQNSDLEVVVVRPPLVYGPGVPGNFLRLMNIVAKGLPLPLGRVDNRRSLVALDNVVDLIVRCLDHSAAAGRTFLVSDGEDLSTPELVRRIARAMGRPARLLPVPVSLLRAGGKLLRREAVIDRLLGSLQVDDSETRRVLDWQPPVTVDEALEETVRWYLAQGKRAGVQ